jgi:ribokinase
MAERGGRVAVLGSLNMDLLVPALRWPRPGETLLSSGGLRLLPGGKGLNQAGAARRAGADVAFVGRLGGDAFAAVLREALRAEGLAVRWVAEDAGSATGTALIRIAPEGENAILVVPGANGSLGPEDAERAAEAIAGADVLLLQGEVPLPASLRAARIAAGAGTAVLWNPAPAPAPGPGVGELLALCDYVLPNEAELEGLGGAAGLPAARALRRRSRGPVLATLGERGALLLRDADGAPRRWPAAPVAVVDTVGAGDAFSGAFAAALAGGASEEDAVRQALAAGALACSRAGGLPSMPWRDEILDLAGRL